MWQPHRRLCWFSSKLASHHLSTTATMYGCRFVLTVVLSVLSGFYSVRQAVKQRFRSSCSASARGGHCLKIRAESGLPSCGPDGTDDLECGDAGGKHSFNRYPTHPAGAYDQKLVFELLGQANEIVSTASHKNIVHQLRDFFGATHSYFFSVSALQQNMNVKFIRFSGHLTYLSRLRPLVFPNLSSIALIPSPSLNAGEGSKSPSTLMLPLCCEEILPLR